MPEQIFPGIQVKFEKLHPTGTGDARFRFTLEKAPDSEAEKIKAEREEMKEEAHQLDLKDGYEQDEEYEESED